MNKYSVSVQCQDKKLDKFDFMVENIEEIENHKVECWYIICNETHMTGDLISFSRGMLHFSKEGQVTGEINIEAIKTLHFRVDKNGFRAYDFEF